jgi:hypothetical protein
MPDNAPLHIRHSATALFIALLVIFAAAFVAAPHAHAAGTIPLGSVTGVADPIPCSNVNSAFYVTGTKH